MVEIVDETAWEDCRSALLDVVSKFQERISPKEMCYLFVFMGANIGFSLAPSFTDAKELISTAVNMAMQEVRERKENDEE